MAVSIQEKRAANTHKVSLLSKLPDELRNKIYRNVLVHEKTIPIKSSTMKHEGALLQTCHQIRSEASNIFYSENIFSISSMRHKNLHVSRFLGKFQNAVGSMIAKLVVLFELNGTQKEKFNTMVYDLSKGHKLSGERTLSGLACEVVMQASKLAPALFLGGVRADAVAVTMSEKYACCLGEGILGRLRDAFDDEFRHLVREELDIE